MALKGKLDFVKMTNPWGSPGKDVAETPDPSPDPKVGPKLAAALRRTKRRKRR